MRKDRGNALFRNVLRISYPQHLVVEDKYALIGRPLPAIDRYGHG